MSQVLDLRLQGKFSLLLTKGISYDQIEIDFKNQSPPNDLRITLTNWNGGLDRVYSVGNGISVSGTKAIWNIGLVNPQNQNVVGKMTTINNVFGAALNIDININVS